jgi:RNA polymerase sigma-70 factor (ECF subfamily)
MELDFEMVYAEHKEKVWKLTSRYVAPKQDREDIFQEVFIRIHKALPKFRGESSLETWIYRITANTAISYLKKQKRYKLLKNTLVGMNIIQSDGPVPPAEELKFKPLDKLNPQQRMIIILHDVEDKKLEEIAAMLGIPIGTVKSNLFRGRDTIRKTLEDKHEIL